MRFIYFIQDQGDEIDNISFFDTETQRRTEMIDSIEKYIDGECALEQIMKHVSESEVCPFVWITLNLNFSIVALTHDINFG